MSGSRCAAAPTVFNLRPLACSYSSTASKSCGNTVMFPAKMWSASCVFRYVYMCICVYVICVGIMGGSAHTWVWQAGSTSAGYATTVWLAAHAWYRVLIMSDAQKVKTVLKKWRCLHKHAPVWEQG